MRLTLHLLKGLYSKNGPNFLYRGKYRVVKKVTPEDRRKLVSQYQLEEQNLFYLRHPYLTLEQERGHAQALQKKDKWMEKFKDVRTTYKEPVTFEQHYAHLKVNEKWE